MDADIIIVIFVKYYTTPMIANAMPVLVSRGTPIDGGRLFIDGRRILGEGKTWEGFVVGVVGSMPSAIIISIYFMEPRLVPILVLSAALALVGDIIGSFIKRRLGLKRGDPLPPLDQLDFVLIPTMYYIALGEITCDMVYAIMLILLIIFVLHVATNAIAYLLGLKDRPW